MICKREDVKSAPVQAEIKVGGDHLLVLVDDEVCAECGEAYYSTETMRYREQVRETLERKTLSTRSIGYVHQVSQATRNHPW